MSSATRKRLLDHAETGAEAITPDSGPAPLNELAGVRQGLGALGADDVDTLTMPVRHDPAGPDRAVPVRTGPSRG